MQSKGILQIPRNVTATLISALRIKYKYNKYFMEDRIRRSRANLSLSSPNFSLAFWHDQTSPEKKKKKKKRWSKRFSLLTREQFGTIRAEVEEDSFTLENVLDLIQIVQVIKSVRSIAEINVSSSHERIRVKRKEKDEKRSRATFNSRLWKSGGDETGV